MQSKKIEIINSQKVVINYLTISKHRCNMSFGFNSSYGIGLPSFSSPSFGIGSSSSFGIGSSSSFGTSSHSFSPFSPSSSLSVTPSGLVHFDHEKSRMQSDAFAQAQREKENARLAQLDADRMRDKIRAEETSLQMQKAALERRAAQEKLDHEARMKKVQNIESQIEAIEELKRVADTSARDLHEETEECKREIDAELIEHERKLADLDSVHETILSEQRQKLNELKEKTEQQERVVERSEEGLEKIIGYAESFRNLGVPAIQ